MDKKTVFYRGPKSNPLEGKYPKYSLGIRKPAAQLQRKLCIQVQILQKPLPGNDCHTKANQAQKMAGNRNSADAYRIKNQEFHYWELI